MEKVSTLRSTIASLQDLTVQSAKLHQDFQSEAVSVENEYKDQINHFSEFEDQQDRVRTLEDRIQKGVTKTQSLSDRLEASRKRAELWEKRENEWQARTSSTFQSLGSIHLLTTSKSATQTNVGMLWSCSDIAPGPTCATSSIQGIT